MMYIVPSTTPSPSRRRAGFPAPDVRGLVGSVPRNLHLCLAQAIRNLPRSTTLPVVLPLSPRMKEYQAVILRLTQRTRDDEDALTDLLNERSRGGWEADLMTQQGERLTLVFSRPAPADLPAE